MEIMIKTILWHLITQCTGTQGIIKKLLSYDLCGRKNGLKTVAFLLRLSILIYLSMSVSVFLEITKLDSITVCERSVTYWRYLVLP